MSFSGATGSHFLLKRPSSLLKFPSSTIRFLLLRRDYSPSHFPIGRHNSPQWPNLTGNLRFPTFQRPISPLDPRIYGHAPWNSDGSAGKNDCKNFMTESVHTSRTHEFQLIDTNLHLSDIDLGPFLSFLGPKLPSQAEPAWSLLLEEGKIYQKIHP